MRSGAIFPSLTREIPGDSTGVASSSKLSSYSGPSG